MLRVAIFLFLSIISGVVATAQLHSGKYCPQSCEAIFNYIAFNDTDTGPSWKIRKCRSDLSVTGVYLCLNIHCRRDDGEVGKWLSSWSAWCEQHSGNSLPEFDEVVDSWTPEKIASIRRFNATEALSFPTADDLILPDESFFESAFNTLEAAFYEYDIHLVYGWYMINFWIVVCAVGTIVRLLGLIRDVVARNRKYRALPGDDGSGTSKGGTPSLAPVTWLKRTFTTPATFGSRCSQPYGWCTIPARAQSLTILVFTILNILACIGDYRLTDENIYWPEKSAQLLRYVSDRTGIISFANFPLIWLFGMRNDVLLWLTGWGFGTFNAFHRWVARIATVQAVVHSIGYTVMIWSSGGWDGFLKYWTKHYFWNGELSTIAMCALVAFSLYGIRRSHYEIFLVTHIVLSIVALWTMYYHVEIFTEGEWNIFIWPCLAIWLFDRFLRAARIVIFDWKFWNTRAKVSYDPSSNLIKMEVPVSRCLMKNAMLSPGAYYYIYTLDDVRYLHQSHPFTMAYVSSSMDMTALTPLHSLHRSGDSSERDSLLNSSTASSSSIVLLIRPYDGFTSRLQEKCLLRPTDLPVLIEGPYGHSEPLHSYTNVLFVVGGTGIAVPLSHLASILSSESMVQSLKIVWAVRQHGFLASILQEFKGLLADERVDMEVHVTRREESYDDVLGEDVRSVRLMTGRPDVRASVEHMAKEAGRQSLAVVACGPARMADQARRASVEMLGAGHIGVEYFEESFKW